MSQVANTNTRESSMLLNSYSFSGKAEKNVRQFGPQLVEVTQKDFEGHAAELSKPKKLQGELSEWVAPQLPDLPHRSFAQRARSKLGRVTPGDVDFSVKKVQWVLQTVIDVIDFMHNRLHGEPFARVYTHVTEFSELIGNETLRELSYVSQALELRSRLNEFFTHDLNPLDHEKQRFVDIFRKADRELVKLDNVLARFYNK